jgi:O-antigen/teichoic acid export membrane protein
VDSKSNKNLLKNVATLMSGTLIAQIISFVTFTYLIRHYYSPTELSDFMWFYEFITIFATIGALRMEAGVILEQDDNIATQLMKLCLKSLVAFSVIGLLVALIGTFVNDSFQMILSNPIILIAVPIAIFSIGSVQLFTAWFTREQNFKTIATNKVVQNTGGALGQFLFALSKFTSIGLILGKVAGGILAFLFLARKYFTSKKEITAPISDKVLLKRNKDFVLFSTPGTMIGTFINFLLIHLFLTYYSDDIAGEIGAAKFYLGLGFSIVSSAFAQVFYSNIAKIDDKKELRKYYTYWLLRLIAIAAVALIIIQIIPNSLVISILGEKWSNLLSSVRIMAIWMSIMFVSSSLSYIYIKVNQQKTLILFDLFHLLFIWLSIFISYKLFNDPTTSLIWFTIAQSIYYVIAIIAAYYFIEKFKSIEN